MKVISILTHIPQKAIHNFNSADAYKKRFPLTECIELDSQPYWVGFFKLDWHHKWSKYIKDAHPEIEIECWRPYGNIIDKVYQKNVDGLKHKIFPSKSVRIKKVGELTTSSLMFHEAVNEIKQNNEVIFHFYGTHTTFNSWLALKLGKHNAPIIFQHLGGWFGHFDYKKSIKNIFKLIPYYFEKKSLKHVNKYITASVTELDFLKKRCKFLNYEFLLNGIDFEQYVSYPKNIAKANIGRDPKNKIILYIGRFNDVKNVNYLIDAYNKIKKNDKDVFLYLVGGYKDEKYYEKAINSGAIVIERSDKPIDKFVQAADVYVMPVKNYGVKEFGGIGISVLEALACNTPVISENLKHSLWSTEEMNTLGITDFELEALDIKIMNILNNPSQYENCREIAMKYFDIKTNTKRIVAIYKELLSIDNHEN